jgi:hypothetical protein
MNRKLAKTILAALGDSEMQPGTFACFKKRDWERSYDWLDTSGIALYLLDSLKKRGIASSIPPEILLRLEEKQKDNVARTEQLFCEFREINTLFRQASVRFVNLKGITLVPGYCSDPNLRFQVDLDFLVDQSDAKLCKEILESRGYSLAGITETTWEFKAGRGELPVLRDMYKPKPQRSVEVHFTGVDQKIGVGRDFISRAQFQTWNGFVFPALSESDKFLAQARHFYKHLRGEWTRLSWVLEYRRYISSRQSDDGFWSEVRERAEVKREAVIAIGMCSAIAAKAFGECPIPGLDSWTSDVLPTNFNRWIERYGDEILVVEFPGTKLYLLLDDQSDTKRVRSDKIRNNLWPLHLPPRVVEEGPSTTLLNKWIRRSKEIKYIAWRLRFHARAALRHVLETTRLKLIM